MEPESNQHLSAEQLIELVEQGRRHKSYSAYTDHIVECPLCRETYRQLLETETIVREARSSRKPLVWRWAWGAATVAAAAVLLVMVWFLLPRSAPSWQTALRVSEGVAYEGSIRLPGWLTDARALYESPPTVTRSGLELSPSIALVEPDPANEGVQSQSPQFEWRAAPNAQRYFALLEPVSTPGQPIVLEVAGTSATLPEGTLLKPGERYRLRLSTTADDLANESVASYEFRILTQEEQARLRWARENANRAPYASALTFYQLGYYREALNLLRRQPQDPTTQKWLNAIEEQIRLRGGIP
ncbi:MAG: hypothetical protein SNJ72_04320 [Fimbriimonadales bacterium]